MKEQFTTEEWNNLKVLPIAVCFLVAAADGTIDRQEVNAILMELGGGASIDNELHRELILDMKTKSNRPPQGVGNQTQAQDHIVKTKDVLKAKLSNDEYQDFIGSLFMSGVKVAKASGGFLGIGDKVSTEEKVVLAAVAAAWDLKPEALKKYI